MRRRSLLLVPLLAAVLLPRVASAQPAPAPPPPAPAAPDHDGFEREGFVIGLGFGPASLVWESDAIDLVDPTGGSEDGPIGGVGIEVRLGAMLTRNLAFLITIPLAFAEENQLSYAQACAIAGVRFFPTSVFWIEGGFGTGTLSVRDQRDFEYEVSHGRVLYAGAGIDVFRGERFALSVEVKVMQVEYDDDSVLGYAGLLGLTWY
jgi:hypothetical protein